MMIATLIGMTLFASFQFPSMHNAKTSRLIDCRFDSLHTDNPLISMKAKYFPSEIERKANKCVKFATFMKTRRICFDLDFIHYFYL
jgi:hypothetical protein